MSHRAEEKERRRQERLAAEEAAKKSADRRKRLGLVGGVVLAVAVIAIVVIATGVLGGDDGGNASETGGGGGGGAIPAQQIDNLNEAVRASGCKLTESKEEGRGHTGEAVKYATNPPTSGDHDPTPAEDGIYEADGPPDVEQSVHSLEHGRILIQYKEGTSEEQIAQLETLANEEVKGESGYHTLMFQNQTDMEPAVAVTAWRKSLTCDTFDPKMFDAIRAFRRENVDKAPEFIP